MVVINRHSCTSNFEMVTHVALPKKAGKSSRLSNLIPGLLALAALSDVALRFVPPRLVAFRSWEAMMLFVTGEGPFVRNQRYDNPRSFGDLANSGNLPGFRQYHREVFTTDAQGFRNQPLAWARPPEIVLFGDSFATGAGVSDEDTLSRQLDSLQTAQVFNAALCPMAFDAIDACIAASRVANGLVILQLSERYPIPEEPSRKTRSVKDRLFEETYSRLPGPLRREALAHRLGNDLRYSPLSIWASRAYRALQNDLVLPNTYKERVLRLTLVNGEQMLFLPSEVRHYQDNPSFDISYVVELNRHLNDRGQRLLVLLVPDKYTVYFPLVRDAPAAPVKAPLYLDRLEAALAGAGLNVINLTEVFRASAAESLARGQYIYWIDDSHWNQAGIRIAAEQLARRIQQGR
jgi:SGNH hydrolase-like domain, acetyltransferase AlgX